MNNGLKYGLFFLGGLALGVVGTVAVTRGKLDLKPLEAQDSPNRNTILPILTTKVSKLP